MENTEANVTSTKNAVDFGCLFCPSVILKSGVGAEETRQFDLPKFHKKTEGESETELINKFWVVQDMFHFENVGFSKTVGNIKYLTCADCEMGPIGWHCLDSKLSYVAEQRIKQLGS